MKRLAMILATTSALVIACSESPTPGEPLPTPTPSATQLQEPARTAEPTLSSVLPPVENPALNPGPTPQPTPTPTTTPALTPQHGEGTKPNAAPVKQPPTRKAQLKEKPKDWPTIQAAQEQCLLDQGFTTDFIHVDILLEHRYEHKEKIAHCLGATTLLDAEEQTNPSPETQQGQARIAYVLARAAAHAHLANPIPEETTTLTLTHWETHTWKNGAMGCDEDAGISTQAQVDGYIAVFERKKDGAHSRVHIAGHNRYWAFATHQCSQVSPDLPQSVSADPDQERARTAAALHLGVRDPRDLTLLHWQEYTWGNGAMGCARPGQSYTEALVDGHVALFETADGRQARVHLSATQALIPRTCVPQPELPGPTDQPQGQPSGLPDLYDGSHDHNRAFTAIREYRAKKAEEPQQEPPPADEPLRLVHWEAVTWPDGALGCTRDSIYIAAQVPGFYGVVETSNGEMLRVHLGHGVVVADETCIEPLRSLPDTPRIKR